jgi:hypothetical protein
MAFHVFLMKLSFIFIFIVGLGGVNNSWLKVEGFFSFEGLKVFSNFSHICFIKIANCFINVEIEQHVSLDVVFQQHVASSKLVVVSSNATPIDP